MTGVDIRVWAR